MYSFSNTIEHACIHSIGLKTETESVPVAQWKSIAFARQKVGGSIPREHTY